MSSKAINHRKIVLKALALRCAGFIFVALGVLGIILPILPTTPFLLAAAACFVRSSDRLYQWLIGNRWFGEYIRRYRDKEGIPLITKIFTIILLWSTLTISAVFFARSIWLILLLLGVGIGVTIHLCLIKTYKAPAADHQTKHPGSGYDNNPVFNNKPLKY
ncbi:MAG: YbaN family protein [Candidatus Cloacimonetes bacterium]|nr:YbaN family protein [Candidatus Cloacimonadota bacterium]MDD2718826.1 YbaN family protein [Candidatus Cloacimonadota bacterium]